MRLHALFRVGLDQVLEMVDWYWVSMDGWAGMSYTQNI